MTSQLLDAATIQFCFEGTNILSLFAEGSSHDEQNIKHKEISTSTLVEEKFSFDDTESRSEDDNNSDLHSSSPSNQTFRLLYLPIHLPKADILQKLSKFGQVVDFRFCPVAKSDPHLQDPSRVPNFQCAEFSFADKAAIDYFSGVKRIRVRGLQVRVASKESLQSFSDSDGESSSKARKQEQSFSSQSFPGPKNSFKVANTQAPKRQNRSSFSLF